MSAAERWQRIDLLFEEALKHPQEERRGFLDSACEDDPALGREVESLLAAHEDSSRFMDKPALASPSRVGSLSIDTSGPAEDALERTIGPYKILSVIASGGMGTVYLAERADHEYQRRVAVKVMRQGVESDYARSRFLKERQALAALNHPNIGQLLDGGSTAEGLPYLVMEYVEGEPIDRYVDAHGLTVFERLELFRVVCGAVEYAHRNLVVHRDIKPSNLLVTGDGSPKLLDFGIAKLLDPEVLPEDAPVTATVHRLLTPEYASPEQIRGSPIATASDIYSLGVLLYQLLTGCRPYRVTGLQATEMERVICEKEPPKPSTAALYPDQPPALQLEQEKLRRRLTGDLDNIVMKALNKEPHRRYASVAEFSEDIRRHLAGLPVIARDATFFYRSAKFVRRHRVALLIGVLFLSVLLGGIIATSREAERATESAEMARRGLASLTELLKGLDPTREVGALAENRELLDRQAAKLARDLENYPEELAPLLETIAEVYLSHLLNQSAIEWMEKAIALRRQFPRPDELKIADDLHKLGEMYYQLPDRPAAEREHREALAIYRRVLKDDDPRIGKSFFALALIRWAQKDYETPKRLFPEAVRIQRQSLGGPSFDVLETLRQYGRFQQDIGEYSAARKLFDEGFEMAKKLCREEDHLLIGEMHGHLAGLFQDTSDYELAKKHFERFRRILERRLGPTHYRVLMIQVNYSLLLKDMGDFERAVTVCREALNRLIALDGEDDPWVARAYVHLALVYMDKGDLEDAERTCRKALDIFARIPNPIEHWRSRGREILGCILTEKGEFAKAVSLLRQRLDNPSRKALPPQSWKIANTQSMLAAALIGLGEFEEAETLLLESFPRIRDDRGPQHRRTRETLETILKLYREWGKPKELAKWEAELGRVSSAR